MTELIIANAYVATLDGERRIFREGAVVVAGNRIAAVGPSAALLAAHPGAQIIDARGMLAVPGLVDVHCHPAQYLATGIGDDTDIMTWLFQRVMPFEAGMTAGEAHIGALGCLAACLRSGITCFADPGGEHPDAIGRAAEEIGIRGIVTHATADRNDEGLMPAPLIKDIPTNLRQSEAVVRRWHGAAGGRIRAGLAMRYVFDVSDELCRAMKDLADRHGIVLQLHAAAVRGENEIMLARKGSRTLQWLHGLGLFGPNLLLVHMGFPDEAEIALLKAHDVKVAHCPSATMLGGYGVIHEGMIPKMIEAGIAIGLGTDAASAGGHHDMVRVMYLAACAHKDTYADATLIGAYKALEMATIEGARALLWEDEIGSLEPGKKADIALFDMTGLDWHAGREPVGNLVYSATGQAADTVLVDGRIVLRHGRLTRIDEHQLKTRLAEATKAWRGRAGIDIQPPWPVF